MKDEQYEIVVIGGSAGSFKLIKKILISIPKNYSLSILIVLHRKWTPDNYLLEQLNALSRHTVLEVEEKEKIEKGNVYVAPADYHVLIEEDKTFSLDYSEKVNYSRPSIDVTFESVSYVYKNKVIAVLLSGSNCDGADGIKAIKANGGLTIIQDPKVAEFKIMPSAAIQQTKVDHIFNEKEIIDSLIYLN